MAHFKYIEKNYLGVGLLSAGWPVVFYVSLQIYYLWGQRHQQYGHKY